MDRVPMQSRRQHHADMVETMSKRERDKGARYERHIKHRLQEVYEDEHVVRGNQRFAAFQPDVVIPDYWVECTHSKSPRINAKIKQALRDLNQTPDPEQKAKVPMIVSRQDREGDWVTVPLDHFLLLLKKVRCTDRGAPD